MAFAHRSIAARVNSGRYPSSIASRRARQASASVDQRLEEAMMPKCNTQKEPMRYWISPKS